MPPFSPCCEKHNHPPDYPHVLLVSPGAQALNARSPQQHHTARAQLGRAAAGYEQQTRKETRSGLNMTHKKSSRGRPRPSHAHGYHLYSNLPVTLPHPYCDNGAMPLNQCLPVRDRSRLQLSMGNGEAV